MLFSLTISKFLKKKQAKEKNTETKEQKNDLNNLNLAMITRAEEIRKATTPTTKNKNENICNNASILSILFKSSIVQKPINVFWFKNIPGKHTFNTLFVNFKIFTKMGFETESFSLVFRWDKNNRVVSRNFR